MIAELALSLSLMQTQLVKNPRHISFTCADHDRDDQHEVDIVRVSDGQVIQTLLIGDPPADANGVITAEINVQPIAFGTYRAVVRAIAGTLKSEDSAPSANQEDNFERVPGKPGSVVVKQ